MVCAIAQGFALPTAEDSRESSITLENDQVPLNRTGNATFPNLSNGLPNRVCHRKWYHFYFRIFYNSIQVLLTLPSALFYYQLTSPVCRGIQCTAAGKGLDLSKIDEFRPNCDLECIDVKGGFGSIQQHSSASWGKLRCESFADEYCQVGCYFGLCAPCLIDDWSRI